MDRQPSPSPAPVVYPDSDGKPIADNTRQLRWILTLYDNLTALFADRPDVFVAGDLLWYPVKGQPEVRTAPDTLVVFGRPKGDRGSYKQWEENNIPVTVTFEVLSPGNTAAGIAGKHVFYEEHGVEEYYVYDPDRNQLMAYMRQDDVLCRVLPVENHVSPRLGIRFDLSGKELVVYRPDGERFLTFVELDAAYRHAEQRVREAERRIREAGWREARAAELSRKARRGQASAEELQELDRLEGPPPSP